MLRKITLFTLLISVLLAISCKKNEAKSAVNDDFIDESFFSEEIIDTAWEMGYVLRVNAGLYSMETDTGSSTDIIKWAASLNLGDSVMVGEERKATYNNTVYDVYKVRTTTGNEGFSLVSQIAVGGKLAVVTDDRAFLYGTANVIDVTGLTLSRRTVMVYYPDTYSDGFVEIRAYDPVAERNRHGNFVRLTSLSEKKSDVQSSILLQTALPLSNTNATQKARKDALLESALMDYPDSVFNSEIYELIFPPEVNDTAQDSSLDDDN